MNADINISDIRLTTERLRLRAFRTEDLEDFNLYASVDGVGQMAGWLPHRSIEESRMILDIFIKGKKTFAIEYEGKVIGSVGIEEYDEEELLQLKNQKGRELGYVLAKDFWGRGFMPEAVNTVIDFLFKEAELDFIVCGHAENNRQSERVQEKCGFRHFKKYIFKTRWGEGRVSWLSLLTKEEYLMK